MHTNTHTHTHIYIYIYKHTHTCKHTYTYIHTCRSSVSSGRGCAWFPLTHTHARTHARCFEQPRKWPLYHVCEDCVLYIEWRLINWYACPSLSLSLSIYIYIYIYKVNVRFKGPPLLLPQVVRWTINPGVDLRLDVVFLQQIMLPYASLLIYFTSALYTTCLFKQLITFGRYLKSYQITVSTTFYGGFI